jgi:hypothetical protein
MPAGYSTVEPATTAGVMSLCATQTGVTRAKSGLMGSRQTLPWLILKTNDEAISCTSWSLVKRKEDEGCGAPLE